MKNEIKAWQEKNILSVANLCVWPSPQLGRMRHGEGRDEKPAYLQKNSHKSKFWILWILLIRLRSIVFPKRLATSLYSCVWFCRETSWEKKFTQFSRGFPPTGPGWSVLRLPALSYLVGNFGIHVLPVCWHGDGLIFTDVTSNSKKTEQSVRSELELVSVI